MVSADGIRDEFSLRMWLEERPRADGLRIAVRTAQRVAPLVWARPVMSGREGDWNGLAICRALLIAGAAGKMPTLAIESAARSACAATSEALSAHASNRPFAEAVVAAAAAADDVAIAARAAGSDDIGTRAATFAAVADANFAVPANAHDIWEQIRYDARALAMEEDPLAAPLWSIPHQGWFQDSHEDMRAIWAKDNPEHWDFWLRWWDGVVSGRQIDWTLQEKVALIPDAIWDQGPAAVAAEIARIEERLRLLREVARLKTDLAGARAEIAALARRSHNNPPELVEPVAEVERQVGVLVEGLTEAEAELARDAPRPAVLRRVSQALAYCASLADTAAKNAAATAGKIFGSAIVAILIGNLEAVQGFAQALMTYAKSLAGG